MRDFVVILILTFAFLASQVGALEVDCFRNGDGGFFRISLGKEDLRPGMENGFFAVPDSENLFGIQVTWSRETDAGPHHRFNRYDPSETTREERELQEAAIKADGELQALWQDQEFTNTLLERVRKGEIKVPPEEQARLETRAKGFDARREELNQRISGNRERLNAIQEARYRKTESSARVPPIFQVDGRFREGGAAKLRLTSKTDGRVLREIPLSLPTSPGGNPDVVQGWLDRTDAALAQFSARTPGDSVFSFLRRQLPRRFKPGADDGTPTGSRTWDQPAGPRPDLYSLTTGALAIQEALQLDRMTGTDGASEAAEIPLGRLSGPQVRSHPFAEMIGSRTPVLPPIDRLVPEEFYSCHFRDINAEIALSDLMDQWGSSLLQAMDVTSHDARVKEKYLQQLCLELSALTRMFGDKVIGELVICGSDPFLHEGTDLTAIFAIRNRVLFDLQFKKNVALAHQAFPRLSEETSIYEGVPILAVTTPDRKVHSFSAALGEFAVVGNCRRSLELIIDAWKGRHPSLAKADDLRYLRTIFPAGAPQEDFFVYFSDRHIRNLVGPAWKIARRRRLQCINSLRMIHNALALWGAERAPGSPDLEALRRGHFLEEGYLLCPDGGRYSLDPDSREPLCSRHGGLRYAVPIVEMVPELITATEQEEYQRFVAEYNRYWSKFFDPVGIRGQVRPEGVILETCILPLVENTVYDLFRGFAGGTPARITVPEHPRTIGQFLCKLDLTHFRTALPDSRQALDPLVGQTTLTTDEFINALGDGLSINVVDTAPTFNLLVPENAPVLPELFRNPVGLLGGSFLLSGLTFPTYAAVAVRKPAVMERFLGEWLLSQQKENERARASGRSWLTVEVNTYAARGRDQGVSIYTLDLLFLVARFHFFFAVHDGFLLIANRRDLLLDLLGPTAGKFAAEANLLMRVIPERFREVADTGRLLWQERCRKACLNNLGSLHALYHFRGFLPATWSARALAVIGYAPVCPLNGIYGIDPAHGEVRCSVHGELDEPRQPLEYDPTLPLHAFLGSLKEVQSSLQFTPEGLMTKVLLRR